MLNSLRMRTDILPLCDQHYRTMEPALAPYNADYSIEFFRCTDKFCHRCFGERVGYSTPKRGDTPVLTPNQPTCDRHGRPMFIISLDRQRNHVTFACPEPDCTERVVRTSGLATPPRRSPETGLHRLFSNFSTLSSQLFNSSFER